MKKNFRRFLAVSLVTLMFVLSLGAAENRADPKPAADGAWTLVVFPDPQQYTNETNFPIYEMMMNWIVANKENYNILNVVCVGDLVNENKTLRQWEFTSKAFAMLDGVYPYAVCTGNHDYGGPKATADTRESHLEDYFTVNRNPAWKGVLKEMGENAFGKKNLENAAYEQTTPGGQKILIISLAFAPTDKNLDWAKSLAADEEYADDFVIVLTHDYLLPHDRNNLRDAGKGYDIQKADGNSGEEIWQKLVFPSKNIRMVISGHHSAVDTFSNCVGFRQDKNEAGRTVAQMVFDTQALGGGWNGNGGDGWIRLLEFSGDMKRVKVKTFSPLFAISPSTEAMAWDRAPYNEFEFDLD